MARIPFASFFCKSTEGFHLISLLMVYRAATYFSHFHSFLLESFLVSITALLINWSCPLTFKTFVNFVCARASEFRRRSHPFLAATQKLFMEVLNARVRNSRYQHILALSLSILVISTAGLSFSLSLPLIYSYKTGWSTYLLVIGVVAILCDDRANDRIEVKGSLGLILMLLLSEVLHVAFFLFLWYAIFFGFVEASLRHARALSGHKDDESLVDDGYSDIGDAGHSATWEVDSRFDDSDVSSDEIISLEDESLH